MRIFNKIFILFMLLECSLQIRVLAISSLVDSFDGPNLLLSEFGQPNSNEQLAGSFFDSRRTHAAGVSTWQAETSNPAGSLSYTVRLRGAPNGRDWFDISYIKSSDTFSLQGVDGFVITVGALVGAGDLIVYTAGIERNSTPVPILGPGEIFYPLAYLGAAAPLDFINNVNFRLIARSADFSVQLQEIRMIPEPASFVLIGVGGGLVLRRRSRRR